MTIRFANNAWGVLATSILASDLAFTVQAGQGIRFPVLQANEYFYGTFIDQSNNLEIFKCTARTSDTFTISGRGLDGTTARAYSIGDRIEIRPTAISLEEVASLSALAASVSAPGSVATYGAFTLKGTKNTYNGVNFRSADGLTNLGTFLGNAAQHGWYNAADNAWAWFCTNAGAFVATGDVSMTSDERLKTNWRKMPDDFIEQLVEKVLFGTYDRTDIVKRQAGASAQSLLQVFREIVSEKDDGFLSVAYGNGAMVIALALCERVVAMGARIESLEQRLAAQ